MRLASAAYRTALDEGLSETLFVIEINLFTWGGLGCNFLGSTLLFMSSVKLIELG
jgi:hypothetical protein